MEAEAAVDPRGHPCFEVGAIGAPERVRRGVWPEHAEPETRLLLGDVVRGLDEQVRSSRRCEGADEQELSRLGAWHRRRADRVHRSQGVWDLCGWRPREPLLDVLGQRRRRSHDRVRMRDAVVLREASNLLAEVSRPVPCGLPHERLRRVHPDDEPGVGEPPERPLGPNGREPFGAVLAELDSVDAGPPAERIQRRVHPVGVLVKLAEVMQLRVGRLHRQDHDLRRQPRRPRIRTALGDQVDPMAGTDHGAHGVAEVGADIVVAVPAEPARDVGEVHRRLPSRDDEGGN